MDIICTECGEKATNFHSKCCGAHMEGIVTEKGEMHVICEICGEYVATVADKGKLEWMTNHIEHIVSRWDDRTSRNDFEDLEEIYHTLCKMIGKDPKSLEELYIR